MTHDHACPFCAIDPARIAFSFTLGHGIWDAFPVSLGHMLIVPRRHAATWEELTDLEKSAAWSAVDEAIGVIRSRHSPDGFNVGFNTGAAAGQTVFHFHLHVIRATPATLLIPVVACGTSSQLRRITSQGQRLQRTTSNG